MTNTNMVHIPYKGGAPAITDVIAGQVQMLFSTVIQGLPFIKSGKLKPIAVGSLKRAPSLPQVATIHESGVTGFDVTNWFGVLAPGATPQAVLDRLNSEIVKHLQSPELMQRLEAEGAEPVGGTAREFAALIAKDVEKYKRVVKAAGIKIN
jgi:tripartite-type tricarboxylate transporter receptor subunit TctC